jgi:O-antigen/teichoic acid export membrane protein
MNAIKSTLLSLTSSRILQQAGWLAIAKIVQGLTSVLVTFVVARHLGPKEFGELSLAIAVAAFIAAAAALGLENIATRELAEGTGETTQSLATIRRLRLLGAVAGGGLLLLLSLSTPAQKFGASSLLLVLCLLPLAQIGDVAEWRLIAAAHSKRVAMVVIALSPLAALTRLVLALSGAAVATFAWALVAEWAVRSAALTFASRGMATKSTSAGAAFLPGALVLLRDSMPLLMAGIAVFVYMRIDQFMIAAMLGTRQVGLYSAIVVLAEVPLVLPALLLRAALPVLTRQSSEDPALRDHTLATLMRSGFYLHALVAIVLSVFAEPIVVLLYGESFRAAAMAFRLQVLAAPFVALGVLSSAWLVLLRHTGHALRRTIIGAMTNIVLNLLLIPRYGIAGAAAATLIAQVIATYVADAFYTQTRGLFMMKTRALLPGSRGVL